MKWIGVRYKCACMSREKEVQVPARGKHEDVAEFMERVRDLVGADHALNSAICVATRMEYLRIPHIPHTKIGEVEGGEA